MYYTATVKCEITKTKGETKAQHWAKLRQNLFIFLINMHLFRVKDVEILYLFHASVPMWRLLVVP